MGDFLDETGATGARGEMMGTPRLRWHDGLLLIRENSIVGLVDHSSAWRAFGCKNDWLDTDLGRHETQYDACHAVEKWVKENA